MTVTLNTDIGSVVAQAGQQIDVAALLDITARNNPTYLVVSLLDRDEYTASSNGNMGTLSGDGHTIGFSNIGGDSDTVGIVFTYNASTGQYTNATYGNLANLLYTASTNTNDNTSISFFTTNNSNLAYEYANNPYVLELDSPAVTHYLGSISVVTQPAFARPTPTQATPDSIEAAAMSFVGEAWNMDGCWVLASNISAEAGASLPITSTSLGIPGVPSGEWIVAFNGPAGQAGNWESMITAGEMVVFETSATSGHITTVVSGSGSSAMLVDNITYVNQNGQIVNSANDGSANDIIISAPHLASQEWAMAVPGSVVVYELDCPIITVKTAVSTDAAGATEVLAALFSASNPLAGQAITQYQFYDVGTGGAASDSFMVGSTDEIGHSAANAITVSASALSTVDLLAGTSSGTDTIEVRAFNGSYWGDWISMTVDISGNVSAPPFPVANANDTTIPAVAVEGSMYGAIGSSAEITLLATQFLPAQVAYAIQNGFNPQIYACEALGLVFAFGNENGSTGFATAFGPSAVGMPNTSAGDAAFAAAAANTIFGSAETTNTPGAIDVWLTNWKAFYTQVGLPGNSNPTADQIDLAARGAAWGDAVGFALANDLGPLSGQAANFLEDAAQGTAVYSASLSSQPTAAPFQGAASASVVTTASDVQVTGVAAPIDHIVV